jgi:hypothetical protein
VSHEFRSTPTDLLKLRHKQADKKLGEEIQRMARLDIGFSWALWESMEIDAELERRGILP